MNAMDAFSIRSRDSIGSLNTAVPRLRRQQQSPHCLQPRGATGNDAINYPLLLPSAVRWHNIFLLAIFGVVLAGALFLLSEFSPGLFDGVGYALLLSGVLAGGALFSFMGGLALSHYDVSKPIN